MKETIEQLSNDLKLLKAFQPQAASSSDVTSAPPEYECNRVILQSLSQTQVLHACMRELIYGAQNQAYCI